MGDQAGETLSARWGLPGKRPAGGSTRDKFHRGAMATSEKAMKLKSDGATLTYLQLLDRCEMQQRLINSLGKARVEYVVVETGVGCHSRTADVDRKVEAELQNKADHSDLLELIQEVQRMEESMDHRMALLEKTGTSHDGREPEAGLGDVEAAAVGSVVEELTTVAQAMQERRAKKPKKVEKQQQPKQTFWHKGAVAFVLALLGIGFAVKLKLSMNMKLDDPVRKTAAVSEDPKGAKPAELVSRTPDPTWDQTEEQWSPEQELQHHLLNFDDVDWKKRAALRRLRPAGCLLCKAPFMRAGRNGDATMCGVI